MKISIIADMTFSDLEALIFLLVLIALTPIIVICLNLLLPFLGLVGFFIVPLSVLYLAYCKLRYGYIVS